MSATYAALWCKTNFSFLEGASHPEELIEAADRLGVDALAVTDRDGLHGIVRAHVHAKGARMRLIVGAQLTVEGGDPLVLLATDRASYARLCGLITLGRLRCAKGESRVHLREVCARAEGLIALAAETALTPEMREAFCDRIYARISRHRIAEALAPELSLRARAAALAVPTVAANEVLYHCPARRPLQDIVTCIRNNVALSAAGRLIKPNAEYDLKTPYVLSELFRDDPAALARTLEIAARCTFSLAQIRYRYPAEHLPDGKNASEWLRELTYAGARGRYQGEPPAKVVTQLERELVLIEKLDYGGYFLTMWEIIEYCREHNILCQGRGSAANSAVCYCLGITAVDPVRMNLLFERFLSEERAEPPDIDLDLEHERREEVIQHVYQKYGRDRAAMVANVIRYRPRSAIRDVGRALGLPETGLDRLARLISHDDGPEAAMTRSGFNPAEHIHHHLLSLTNELLDFPRHLSIHPGGFLLGHEPVSSLVPIENATMAERTVIQWDKEDVEALGLFKVDLLALGALTKLHRCFDLLRKHRGVELSMATIPADDLPTYQAIQRADTVGIFQIESRAQMSMLPRLKPKNYYDIVVQISIVRPGPITGGMVHPYLRRREGVEPVEYPHPSLIPVLEKTYGVPLFQEQVMKLAVVAADYTPGEADQLRRDMAAWRKSGRMSHHRERLISRMTQKGITPEFAERVFQQILGFGEYGFPESHAASFALISYAGSYLKRHFPTEFTCALLNAQPMGFYSPATIVEDARRHQVEVRPIEINRSDWDCSVEGAALRMGLRYVKGLHARDAKAILSARAEKDFLSIEDCVRRVGLDERALNALSEGGVFDVLEPSRRAALWQSRGLARARPTPLPSDGEENPAFAPLSSLETISWDYQRTYHSTHGHPLEPLRVELEGQGLPDARAISRMSDGRRVRYAGLVICRQRPGTASGVTFMTLEDETGFVNLVLWKRVFEDYQQLARTQPFLGVTGRLQVKDAVVHLVAEELWMPQLRRAPVEVDSRDFH